MWVENICSGSSQHSEPLTLNQQEEIIVHDCVVKLWRSLQQAASEATGIKESERLWNIASFMAAKKIMVWMQALQQDTLKPQTAGRVYRGKGLMLSPQT